MPLHRFASYRNLIPSIFLSLVLSQPIGLMTLVAVAQPESLSGTGSSATGSSITHNATFCRDEFLQQSLRQWERIQSLPPWDSLAAVQQQLDHAQKRQTLPLTVATLDRALRIYFTAAWVRQAFQPDASPAPTTIQRQALLRLWDSTVTLANSLSSNHAALKTQVLTEAAIAYQQGGQRERALTTLGRAAKAATDIRGNLPNLTAQTRLAETWIELQRPTDAAPHLSSLTTLVGQGAASSAPDTWLPRLVTVAIAGKQPRLAEEIRKSLPKASPDLRNSALASIAAGYALAPDLKTARSLLDPLVEQTRSLQDAYTHDEALLPLVIHYASSGDIPRLASWTNRLKTPSYRARAWLAIAGETRKLGQTQASRQAIDRLVQEAQTAKMQDQFGSRFDNAWSGEMSNLAQQRGYQPDLNAFLHQFQPLDYAAWLVRDLISQKRFDEADQRLKTPIVTIVDAGPHDHTEELRDLLAQSAARAGHPSLALQRAAAFPQDAERLAKLALALHQGGKGSEADRLFTQAQQAAASFSSLPTAVSAQAAVAAALTETGRSAAAKPVLERLVTLLKTETNPEQRLVLLLSLGSAFDRQRGLWLDVAEAAGWLGDFRAVQALGSQLLQQRDTKTAYRLLSKPHGSAIAMLEFTLQWVALGISKGEPGHSVLDMPLLSLSDGPSLAGMSGPEKAKYYERIAWLYLDAGDVPGAKDAAKRIWEQQKGQRDRLMQRLNCYR
jgi:tetratricopeptide (TPR) repeat protein